METTFIADLEADIGSVDPINTPNYKYSNYKLVYFEPPYRTDEKHIILYGNEFIVGVPPITNATMETLVMSPSLLFSLVNMVKEPLPEGFHSPYLDFITSDAIIQWCLNHGLPYLDSKLLTATTGKLRGFNVEKFRRDLAFLCQEFRIWEAIYKGDRETLLRYAGYMTLDDGTVKELKSSSSKEIPISVLEAYAWRSQQHGAYIALAVDKATNRFVMQAMGYNLFDVAYHQIACLASAAGRWESSGGHMRKCKNCHDYFLGHGNSDYCKKPECDRRLVNKRNKKALMKAGE